MPTDPFLNRQDSIPAEWLTPFELSHHQDSPRYAETMEYFNRLAAASPFAKIFSFGVSPQGRDLNYLVVAGENEFQPLQARASRKAVVLIQNGIHAGEIEGKDASMLLLREILITKEKKHLLENLILLVVPILNVDGHERIAPTNRPNQNGPREMGWRTTSHNLNLNRDYMKADAPEMQAFLRLCSSWLPDFVIDNHTTNGADYQYHITYSLEQHQNVDAELSAWGTGHLMPAVLDHVGIMGFLTGPYIEEGDPEKGITIEASLPRYSTGYAAAQNRLCLLVETHSLKKFGERVFATKAMNEAALEYINTHAADLTRLNHSADERTIRAYCTEHRPLPVEIITTSETRPFLFKGFETYLDESPLTGSKILKYTSTPKEFNVPLRDRTAVAKSVAVPLAYCIPEQFLSLVDRLRVHGIDVETLRGKLSCPVERYRFTDVHFAPHPFEGRQRVDCSVKTVAEQTILLPGTFIIRAAQRTVRLIAHLLEPESPDSFLQWGFFNAFFERKEYAEPFIMEPLARQMLHDDRELREEFYAKLDRDASFRKDPAARLDFFFQRSPFFDPEEQVYPILRIVDGTAFSQLTPFLSRPGERQPTRPLTSKRESFPGPS